MRRFLIFLFNLIYFRKTLLSFLLLNFLFINKMFIPFFICKSKEIASNSASFFVEKAEFDFTKFSSHQKFYNPITLFFLLLCMILTYLLLTLTFLHKILSFYYPQNNIFILYFQNNLQTLFGEFFIKNIKTIHRLLCIFQPVH